MKSFSETHSSLFKQAIAGIFLAMTMSVAAPASAAPVDLSTWTVEGIGTAGTHYQWVVAPDNLSVRQTLNSDQPTVFFTSEASQGKQLSGTITVSGGDDDFIGFVVGFNAGDLANSSSDYILIDWKKADQPHPSNLLCIGTKGLAVSRITAELTSGVEGPWCHDMAYGVTELVRGNTLGSTGWVAGTTYTFSITFTSTLIEVYVNGVLEASVPGTYSNGGFGFYNYSQEGVTYAGVAQTNFTQPSVSVPLSGIALPLFVLLGALGAAAVKRRRSS